MPNFLWGSPATTVAKGTGTHIRDGYLPIPAKIRRGEFVAGESQEEVLDLNVWLQRFALYVGVLVLQSRELMACLINTVRASQEFEGSAYRHQAAATGHSKWSQVNPSLYLVCFTGTSPRTAPSQPRKTQTSGNG